MSSHAEEIARLMGEIRAQVAEIESEVSELSSAVGEFAESTLTQEIEGGAGVVIVDGHGSLLDVRFDRRELRNTNTALLGQRVVAAINWAEARAERLREERFARISH